MYICHAPSGSAAPKAAKANQRWARISRLLFHTAQPPPISRHARERCLVDDLDPAPHALMTDAAKFMAGHQAFARYLETSVEARNVARHEHQIDVGPRDQEAMHHIGAGCPERDRRVVGNEHARRGEGVLLANPAYDDGTIGLERAAKVAVDKFPIKMKGNRIGGLDT